MSGYLAAITAVIAYEDGGSGSSFESKKLGFFDRIPFDKMGLVCVALSVGLFLFGFFTGEVLISVFWSGIALFFSGLLMFVLSGFQDVNVEDEMSRQRKKDYIKDCKRAAKLTGRTLKEVMESNSNL